jgi:hypothetical protein
MINHEIEEIKKILPYQKYPLNVTQNIKFIADGLGENGMYGILIEAYCLGVIDGKREERARHNHTQITGQK